MRGKKPSVVAPDRGSFPLDHFKECEDIVTKYLKCVSKHELMPKRCQQLQKDYLNCRMKKYFFNQIVKVV